MAVAAEPKRTRKARAACTEDEVLRFRECERHLHWAIAIPFKICYLTALILVTVYNPAPMRPFRDVFAWTHRLSGVCLAVLPALTLFIHRREFAMHLRNVREAWSWRLDDLRWLLLMGPATVSKRVALPDQGKFNAAEKINFIVVMSTYPLYIATGLTIWFFRPAYMSWMIHFTMAALATPLVLGHVFMATVNPDTRVGLRGMITGWVSREWARHHYRRWHDEEFGHHERPVPVETVPQPAIAAATIPAPALRAPIVHAPVVPAAVVAARVAAAGTRPPDSRPAVILWPPESSGADPSFAA